MCVHAFLRPRASFPPSFSLLPFFFLYLCLCLCLRLCLCLCLRLRLRLRQVQGARIIHEDSQRMAGQLRRLQQALAAVHDAIPAASSEASLPAMVQRIAEAVTAAATPPLPAVQRTAAGIGQPRPTFATTGTAWDIGRDLVLVQDDPLNRVRGKAGKGFCRGGRMRCSRLSPVVICCCVAREWHACACFVSACVADAAVRRRAW